MVYSSLRELCTCVRREFDIQASKSLIVFPKQLRVSTTSLTSLNFSKAISTYTLIL